MYKRIIESIKNRDLEKAEELIKQCYEPEPILTICVQYDCLEIVHFLMDNYKISSVYYNKALLKSIEYGNLDMVKILLEKSKVMHRYDLAFIESAQYGKIEIIKYLHSLGIKMKSGLALAIAAENGQLDVVKYLHSHNADIHYDDDYPLNRSIVGGYLEVVKYLVSYDCNIKHWALLDCAKNGHVETIKYVLSMYSDDEIINATKDGDELLQFIIKHNPCEYPKLLEAFRNQGIDVYDMIEREQ